MKQKIHLFILVATITHPLQTLSHFQFWSTATFSKSISKLIEISLTEKFRFDDPMGFFYQKTEPGISLSNRSHISALELTYCFILYRKNMTNNWDIELRPTINIYLNNNNPHYKALYRGRFEYQAKQKYDYESRFRNRFTLQITKLKKHIYAAPYITEEFFYSFKEEQVDQNRLYLGFITKLKKQLSIDLHYLWKTDKEENKWKSINILGIKLELSF